jgi:hypothetical protein
MRYVRLLAPLVLIIAPWTFGCSKPNSAPPANNNASKPANDAAETEHAHGTGPNGGVIMDLGSHHAEFTVNHGKQEVTILVLGDDEKTSLPVAATEFVLNIKETKTADGKVVAPMTITLKPVNATDGKTATFVGTDPGIGNVADFAGTVSGEIDGKPAMGEFKE